MDIGTATEADGVFLAWNGDTCRMGLILGEALLIADEFNVTTETYLHWTRLPDPPGQTKG
jgi:hypothetical protein